MGQINLLINLSSGIFAVIPEGEVVFPARKAPV